MWLTLVASCCLLQAVAAHKWYSSVPVLPALVAASDHIADPLCYNHSRMFLQALDNYTLWAVQMLDASAKLPEGVEHGNLHQLGHFDQCLDVSVDDLKGQYCLVEIAFQPLSYTSTQMVDPYSLKFDPRTHVWEKLKESVDSTKITRSILHLGLCLPASCTPDQVQMTLEHELGLLGEREGLVFKARVSPRLCTTQQESAPWTTGEIAYSCLVGLLLLLVVFSSWYAHTHRDYSLHTGAERLLLCFAVQRSISGLMHAPRMHPGLDAIDCRKVIFSAMAVAVHRLVMLNSVTTFDANFLEQAFRSVGMSVFVRATLGLEYFFLSGGMLRTYYTLRDFQKNKYLNLSEIVVRRLMRLTLAYMMVLFFYTTLFYRMGSGPLWESVVGQERDRCQNNWWTNLLYINNYVNTDSMCMFQSWNLSIDTQLFLLCLAVIYCIVHRPAWGYAILVSLFSISVSLVFFDTWLGERDAFLIPRAQTLADLPSSKYFREMYVRVEKRAATYLMGIFTGLLLHKLKDSTFRMSKLQSTLCYLLLEGVTPATLFASYVFYKPGSTHTPLQAALYASLSSVVYAGANAAIILLLSSHHLGTLQIIFSWKTFRVLSKLAYGVYLVHTLPQLYFRGSMRVPMATDKITLIWMSIGDVVFSFALSFLLMLLVESPARALEKLLFQRDKTTSLKQQKTS